MPFLTTKAFDLGHSYTLYAYLGQRLSTSSSLKGFITAVTNFMPVYSLPRPSAAYCMMTVDRSLFSKPRRYVYKSFTMQGSCQLLLFANIQAHQHVAGPLRPFMPRIGVIGRLLLVRRNF